MTGRISKFTYGVFYSTLFDSSNPQHVRRSHKSFVNAMEEKRIPGRFDIMLTRVRWSCQCVMRASQPFYLTFFFRILHNSIALYLYQGTKVLEHREIRSTFHVTDDAPPQHAFPGITKYTGNLATPEWKDVEPGRVFSFPSYLVPKSAQSQKKNKKRQVRNIVSRQGRHLQRPIHTTLLDNAGKELQAEIRRDSARRPHRTQGTGRLDRF